jgi:hypothetical protein
MNLFQLTLEEMNFISMMEETGGEVTDEIMEDLAIRRENFQHKAEAYSKFILKLESEADIAASEIKRIQAIKKTKDNTATRLRETLRDALMVFGNENPKTGNKAYETALFKLSLRKSQSVEITDENEVPDEFWAIKKEISKSTISQAIKDGLEVPGATMKENYGLQIK